MNVALTVNGKAVSAPCEPRTHLADYLRETHNLTGTHIGCEHGVCGACTLLIDGVPARSCITFATMCEGAEITTIEGLDKDEIASELRDAFKREHGLQCGYCTPGMIVSARDVVMRLDKSSEHDVRVAMSGNLCRCTGYVGIVRAIQGVIADRRGRGIPAIPDGGRKALGPTGSGHAAASAQPAGGVARAGANAAISVALAAPASGALKVDADWKPQTTFTQSFTVAHPVEGVWDFFGRLDDVTGCLPGAQLDGAPVDGHVQGKIKVKVGPMSADFNGVAQVTRDDTTLSGTIIGSGKDVRSNSATRGVIGYRVKPAETPGQTRVDVTVGFTLTGMLAQFSRSGLVQDVASRLIGNFVQNLEARLANPDAKAAPVAAEFDAGSLMAGVIKDWARRFFPKLFGRS